MRLPLRERDAAGLVRADGRAGDPGGDREREVRRPRAYGPAARGREVAHRGRGGGRGLRGASAAGGEDEREENERQQTQHAGHCARPVRRPGGGILVRTLS